MFHIIFHEGNANKNNNDYNSTLITKSRTLTTSNAGEDVEQPYLSFILQQNSFGFFSKAFFQRGLRYSYFFSSHLHEVCNLSFCSAGPDVFENWAGFTLSVPNARTQTPSEKPLPQLLIPGKAQSTMSVPHHLTCSYLMNEWSC